MFLKAVGQEYRQFCHRKRNLLGAKLIYENANNFDFYYTFDNVGVNYA